MTPHTSLDRCKCCDNLINYREYAYSVETFNIAMCQPCAREYISKLSVSTPFEQLLHAALVNKGLQAKLHYFDGSKTVDIAILSARLHIEVDGSHHTDSTQLPGDLWRTGYSKPADDVYTLRIPNALIAHNVDEAVSIITQFVSLRQPTA